MRDVLSLSHATTYALPLSPPLLSSYLPLCLSHTYSHAYLSPSTQAHTTYLSSPPKKLPINLVIWVASYTQAMLRYSYKSTRHTDKDTDMLDMDKITKAINFHVNAAKISNAVNTAVENAQAIDQAIALTNSTK